MSDRHAERRGGRRECKTEPHVVPLSLRFGSLRPLVLRVFRRHFIPPVFIILRTPRSALRAAKRPPGSRLRREWSECSEGTRGVTESTEGPDCYQRLEFFIQVLRVLCPNLTDASLVVCVVSLTRRITRSLCSLVSLREGPDRQEGTRPEWGETNRRTAYRSFIHFVRRSSLYASYSRSSFVSAGGHSFPWRSGRRPPVCDAYVMR